MASRGMQKRRKQRTKHDNQRKTGRTVTDTRSRPTMNCGKSTTTRVVVGKLSGAIDDVSGRITSSAPGGKSCATRPLKLTPASPVPKVTTADFAGYTGFSKFRIISIGCRAESGESRSRSSL